MHALPFSERRIPITNEMTRRELDFMEDLYHHFTGIPYQANPKYIEIEAFQDYSDKKPKIHSFYYDKEMDLCIKNISCIEKGDSEYTYIGTITRKGKPLVRNILHNKAFI